MPRCSFDHPSPAAPDPGGAFRAPQGGRCGRHTARLIYPFAGGGNESRPAGWRIPPVAMPVKRIGQEGCMKALVVRKIAVAPSGLPSLTLIHGLTPTAKSCRAFGPAPCLICRTGRAWRVCVPRKHTDGSRSSHRARVGVLYPAEAYQREQIAAPGARCGFPFEARRAESA